MLAIGLAVGYIGMHLTIVRPLQKEMGELKDNVAVLERGVEELVGVRDQVWRTNTLLSGLTSQQKQVDHARQALQSISQFRSDVEAESREIPAARDALGQIS